MRVLTLTVAAVSLCLWAASWASGATVFSDDFTGANGAPLDGSKWTNTSMPDSGASIQDNMARLYSTTQWATAQFTSKTGADFFAPGAVATYQVEYHQQFNGSLYGFRTMDVAGSNRRLVLEWTNTNTEPGWNTNFTLFTSDMNYSYGGGRVVLWEGRRETTWGDDGQTLKITLTPTDYTLDIIASTLSGSKTGAHGLNAADFPNGGFLTITARKNAKDESISFDNARIECVTAPTAAEPRVVSPLMNGANSMFEMAGLYYGTLPTTDPQSRRAEFIKLIKEREIRAMRFPAGTGSLTQYLAEHEDVMRSVMGKAGYPEGDPNKFCSLWQFLDFCKEAEVTPVYEVNTLLYCDGKVVYQLTEADSTKELIPAAVKLDPAKRADAAEALTKLVRKVREKGFTVKHWELGNEEYGYPRMKASDYADIAIRFIRAIREADGEAMIWVTLGSNTCSESDRKTILPWSEEVLGKLQEAGFTNDKNLGFTLHYVWPEYIRSYTKMVGKHGFRPRFAVTEFHMAGLGDYSDLCPRYGYALGLAPYLISMVRLPEVEILCIHELTSQNFGIFHYNQKSYGPPGMETWDASLGYQSMPSAYVYGLFGKLIGGTIIENGVTEADRLVVELGKERRIFFVNTTVNPMTVEWGREIVGGQAKKFECRTIIPSSTPDVPTTQEGVSAQALGRSAYPGDPLRADHVAREEQKGEIGPERLTLTVPSYSINLIRCFHD